MSPFPFPAYRDGGFSRRTTVGSLVSGSPPSSYVQYAGTAGLRAYGALYQIASGAGGNKHGVKITERHLLSGLSGINCSNDKH
jgi:hypothetical protein